MNIIPDVKLADRFNLLQGRKNNKETHLPICNNLNVDKGSKVYLSSLWKECKEFYCQFK